MATGTMPAIESLRHVVVVFGADVSSLGGLGRDPRIRFLGNSDIQRLREQNNAHVVIWCTKGLNKVSIRKIGEDIKFLREKTGRQKIVAQEIHDESKYGGEIRRALDGDFGVGPFGEVSRGEELEPQEGSLPEDHFVASSNSNPPDSATPVDIPEDAQKLADDVKAKSKTEEGFDFKLPSEDELRGKPIAGICREFYELALGDREKILRIVQVVYPSISKNSVYQAIRNARLWIKQNDSTMLARVKHKRRILQMGEIPQRTYRKRLESEVSSAAPLSDRLAAIANFFQELERLVRGMIVEVHEIELRESGQEENRIKSGL